MRLSDICAIAGVAVATMVAAIGLFVPQQVTAEGENAIKPTIAVPELTVDGCAFTLATDKLEYAPGQKPVLTVKAVNTSDNPVTTSVSLSVTATSPASMLSRRLELPQPVWTAECPVSLQPGKSQTFELETDTALPAGQMVSISMSADGRSVLANMIHLRTVPTNQ